MSRGVATVSLLTLTMFLVVSRLAAQEPDQPIVSPKATAKFTTIPNAPECFTIAVEKGDPSKGASVILARFAPHCVAPFHWHTPNETAMIASGTLETQMKGDKTIQAHSGDFVFLPAHHVHRATCNGTAPCMVFLTSDAAFDVHWVNEEGKEIPLDEAIKTTKTTARLNK